MPTYTGIYINLLRNTASNSKLKGVSFYPGLLRGVEIDKDRRLYNKAKTAGSISKVLANLLS